VISSQTRVVLNIMNYEMLFRYVCARWDRNDEWWL